MRVLITGASGFIGRILIEELLKKNYEIIALTRDPKKFPITNERLTLFKIDLKSADTLFFNKLFELSIDVVYHLAAEIHQSGLMYDVNYLATKKLFDASRGKIKSWLQLSSVGVYGVDNHSVEINEESQCDPKSKYEITKLLADTYLLGQSQTAMETIFIIRPSNVIGEGMSSNWLRGLCKAIEDRTFFQIGNKKYIGNYIEVNDLVDSLISLGQSLDAPGGIYIISQEIYIVDLIKAVKKGLGIPHHKHLIINKSVVLFLINFLAFFRITCPLTKTGFNALTNMTKFNSKKILAITSRNSFSPLDEKLFRIASSWKKSGEISKSR